MNIATREQEEMHKRASAFRKENQKLQSELAKAEKALEEIEQAPYTDIGGAHRTIAQQYFLDKEKEA